MSRILYKYTSAKYLDSILKDGGRIKLSCPNSFNDPRDCSFEVAEENLVRSYRMLKNVAFICEFKNDPLYQKSSAYKKLYNLTVSNVKMSHIYYENPGVNLMIKNYLKTRPALRGFFDGYQAICNKTFLDIIDNLKSQALIGSLTTENDNNLMWAHYADKHEGICVEYEFNENKDLLDVVYTDDRNNFDLYTVLQYIIPGKYFGVNETKEMDEKCIRACYLPFLRKVKDWSYEKEVRMIFSLKNTSNLICENNVWFYPNVKVKSVYLGCKIDEISAAKIMDKCSSLNIPVHRMIFEKGKNKPSIL